MFYIAQLRINLNQRAYIFPVKIMCSVWHGKDYSKRIGTKRTLALVRLTSQFPFKSVC